MSEAIKASPLSWPAGWPRAKERRSANFGRRETQHRTYSGANGVTSTSSWSTKKDLTIADGTRRVQEQLEKMGIRDDDIVISTNLELRLDGLPRSGQRPPHDPGAAVYWIDKSKARKVMAIDIYDRVQDNLAAIAASLDALRAIERHGGAQILDRAFTGFTALPAPIVAGMARPWRDVLGFGLATPTIAMIRERYRALASDAHPDRGGSTEKMAEINRARDEALQENGS